MHTVTPQAVRPCGPATPSAGRSGAKVVGKGWLAVAVLPASALSAVQHGNAAGALGQAAQSAAGGPGSGRRAWTPPGCWPPCSSRPRPCSGAWGSGRLVTTSLASMLITSNGHVLIGAVAPSVLYSAAAQRK